MKMLNKRFLIISSFFIVILFILFIFYLFPNASLDSDISSSPKSPTLSHLKKRSSSLLKNHPLPGDPISLQLSPPLQLPHPISISPIPSLSSISESSSISSSSSSSSISVSSISVSSSSSLSPSLRPENCQPLDSACDPAWREWLLRGNISRVADPPECCRPWHAFDMFTLEYAGGYRGILKIRKHNEMTSDVVAYHMERLLRLGMTVPVFSRVVLPDEYKALLGGLAQQGAGEDDARRRKERWAQMAAVQGWVGRVAAEVQPFFERKFIRVDGSVCAKMPGEALHPKVVFGCANGSLPRDAEGQLGHGGERRPLVERQATCRAPSADIVDVLLFDYLLNIVDRKGNCFLDPETGRVLLLDNDSGSWDPERQYPHGSGCCYPNLKRVRMRDILELREEGERVSRENCRFHEATVRRLKGLMAAPGGLGGRLRESLQTDPYFPYLDDLFDRFQKHDPFQVTNDRAAKFLVFFEECVGKFGLEHVFIDESSTD